MLSLLSLIEKIRLHQPIVQLETTVTAAVIILLVYENHDFYLVVTKRSQCVASYAGDYCFPGGIKEHDDLDFKMTAMREVQEELGILQSDYEIIGQLDDFFDRYHRLVRPYFAIMSKEKFDFCYTNTSSEIEKLYFFPLEDLGKFQTDHALEKITKRYPAYKYNKEDVVIWGLTASMMVHLSNILFDQHREIGKGSGSRGR
jgi:8-oxo-dGTP pyrophosphatase MutT (NUDIX family)